jgi:hypothetical protein
MNKPTPEQDTEAEPTQGENTDSPLRGNLQDNADQAELHDMGGDIGPAQDTGPRSPDAPHGEQRDVDPAAGPGPEPSEAGDD